MQIQTKKLIDLLTLLKPVILKKGVVDCVKYVWLGEGKAVVTDLETMVITVVPEAQEPICLPYADLADTLKHYVSKGRPRGGPGKLKALFSGKKSKD